MLNALAAVAIAAVGPFSGLEPATIGSPALPDKLPSLEIARVSEVRPQAIEILAAPGESFKVTVDLGGQDYELDLAPHSIRAADFQVLVQGDDGLLTAAEPPVVSTYRGTVTGQPESLVAASLRNGTLSALIDLGGEAGTFLVEPAGNVADAPQGVHMSYRATDVDSSGITCAAGEIDQPLEGMEWVGIEGQGDDDGADGSGLETCEIACDADWNFYIKNGSSVGATVIDVETMIGMTAMIYERDVDITYELTTVVVRASSAENPYTSSSPITLLCQFRNTWNSTPESNIRRDTAELFTGRTLTGPPVGIAWQSTICNVVLSSGDCGGGPQNLGYSVVESRFAGALLAERVGVSAHEIGHSWSSGHCTGSNCHIMCDNIEGFGCGGIFGANLKFGPASRSQIIGFRNTRTCLTERPDPLDVPWEETFPSLALNTTNWIWTMTGTVTVSSAATGEPSPPNSLRLKRSSLIDYRLPEARSNYFNLEGQSDLELSYQVQTVNVESGERLFVEYRTEGYQWLALRIVSAPGADLGIFLPYVDSLPSSAMHDGFRLRFRTESDDTGDVWYIDDVRLASKAPDCPQDLDGDGEVGFTDLLTVLASWGPCPGCDADIDGDDEVGFTDLLSVLAAWGPCGS